MSKRYLYFKISFLSLSLFFIVFFNVSCEKQNIDFNSNFIDNTITNLVLVDSSTVEVSTVYVDSFVSSNTNTILAGRYKDIQFGTTSSQSFLQLGIPSATYDIPNGSVFDSLEVILKLNKTYYGDTLSPYTISIHQLTDPITFSASQLSFYNNNSRAYNSTELGSSKLVISPSTRDTIAIKLSSTLGKELFDKLQSKDGAVQTIGEFVNYFKGLAIVGGSNNNLIMGFSDSLVMRLHYRKPNVFEENAIIDFGLDQANYQFNNIIADRTGTSIADLGPANKQLLSAKTNNAGYDQYISGAVVKLRFPYLKDLYQLPNFLKIIRAELDVKPVQNSFLGYYTLPPALRLSTTDQTNLLGPDLTITGGTSTIVQYGNLFIDNLYGAQTAYTYDVTNYLLAQLANTETNQNGLLVLPPNATAIFNRLLIANSTNSTNKTQLKIYYASVK